MIVTYCQLCSNLFTDETRSRNSNYCLKCLYLYETNQLGECRVCNICSIDKPVKNFLKNENACKECLKKNIDYTDLICGKCEIKLTPENRSSDRDNCKSCVNQKNKNANQKIIDSGITEKECNTCNVTKILKKFRTPSHHTCSKCEEYIKKQKRLQNIPKQFFKENTLEEERKCLLCLQVKKLTYFSYHTNNYRHQCITCINEFKYYITTRFKKIQEIGIEAFRKHNAEIHAIWVKKNYERIKKYEKVYVNSTEGRCAIHFTSAKLRNLLEENATIEEFKTMVLYFIKKPCYYCNRITKEGSLQKLVQGSYNGLDRVDSNKGYTYENCVSCCTQCNMMKNSVDIASFIRKCCEIAEYNNLIDLDIHTDYRFKLHKDVKLVGYSGNYSAYKTRAKKKELDFQLSKNIFDKITKSICYICGKNGDYGIGLDRFDNDIGYVESNCKPCCNYCNYMKKNYSYDSFLNKVKDIVTNTYNNDSIKQLCFKSKLNHIVNGKNLPYNNYVNDIYQALEEEKYIEVEDNKNEEEIIKVEPSSSKVSENKYIDVTEKICICCNKSLLLGKFGSKGHATCKKCVQYKMILNGKCCTKCDVTLTEENISSGTSQCKECINKKKREYRASKKGKELQK